MSQTLYQWAVPPENTQRLCLAPLHIACTIVHAVYMYKYDITYTVYMHVGVAKRQIHYMYHVKTAPTYAYRIARLPASPVRGEVPGGIDISIIHILKLIARPSRIGGCEYVNIFGYSLCGVHDTQIDHGPAGGM